jgi:hypothetical protein
MRGVRHVARMERREERCIQGFVEKSEERRPYG